MRHYAQQRRRFGPRRRPGDVSVTSDRAARNAPLAESCTDAESCTGAESHSAAEPCTGFSTADFVGAGQFNDVCGFGAYRRRDR